MGTYEMFGLVYTQCMVFHSSNPIDILGHLDLFETQPVNQKPLLVE